MEESPTEARDGDRSTAGGTSHLRKGGGYRARQVCKGEQERRGSFSNGFYLGGEVTE